MRFLNALSGYDNPDGIRTVVDAARALDTQLTTHRAIGYGHVVRATATADMIDKDTKRYLWFTGNRKQESLAFTLNALPHFVATQFPQAIPVAKALVASYMGDVDFDTAESHLRADTMTALNTLTIGSLTMDKAIQLIASVLSTPEQVQIFDNLYKGKGAQIQSVVNAYRNSVDFTRNITDQVPERGSFETELSGYQPVKPEPSPEEKKQQQREKKQQQQQQRVKDVEGKWQLPNPLQ